MNKYLLDTDICIFYLKNKFLLPEKIDSVGVNNCFISEITLAELIFGAYKSQNFKRHIQEVRIIQEIFDVLPILPVFDLFGKEKARLRNSGIIIQDFDLLIGATSVQQKLIMVTNNEKHISRIDGIKIENWRNS